MNFNKLTFSQAIELGEYEPGVLSQYPEWKTFSRHVQFEFIRKAIANRNRHLVKQWAEITNMLDFRLKPHLKEGLKNIEKQLDKLQEDKEKLFVEYSK